MAVPMAVGLLPGTMGTMKEQAHNRVTPVHEPAMVRQVLDVARPGRGERVLDMTVGTGGHSLALAREVGPDGFVLGLDRDASALSVARERLARCAPCAFMVLQHPFSRALEAARLAGVDAFHVVIADLGMGTHQVDDPSRGFAFDSSSRLDMRYDTSSGLTAWDVVNRMSEKELADIFFKLGQERYSRQIAAAICRRRRERPIDTPAQLAELIKGVAARRSAGRKWRIHPATRVMMSLRIFVNDELGELEKMLACLPQLLVPGGRAVILTYHSLEARRVKFAWRRQEKEGVLRVITPKPLRPEDEEISRNPRVRSCQLRAAVKL